jgi:hypothetical protein
MSSFIIPLRLFECQLDIGRQRQQRMCEMKSGMMTYRRHCEERSGRSNPVFAASWIASLTLASWIASLTLAMTGSGGAAAS